MVRAMKIRRLDTIFFRVVDLDQTTKWYQEVLGIEPGPRFGDWQVMRLGGEVTFALHGWHEAPTGVNCEPSFLVNDLEAAIAELADKGVGSVDEEITDTGAKRFIRYADPEGNLFQLIEVSG